MYTKYYELINLENGERTSIEFSKPVRIEGTGFKTAFVFELEDGTVVRKSYLKHAILRDGYSLRTIA